MRDAEGHHAVGMAVAVDAGVVDAGVVDSCMDSWVGVQCTHLPQADNVQTYCCSAKGKRKKEPNGGSMRDLIRNKGQHKNKKKKREGKKRKTRCDSGSVM